MAKSKRTVAIRTTDAEATDLNCVAAFVRIMEAGGFTAAARIAGVPKSSLSRALSKLERELGVVLVQRTTRKLAITDAGQLYLERAQRALRLLAEARAQLVEADAEPRGLVRLTAPVDTSGSLLADPLADFAARYPRIQVECLFTQRRLDLVAEGIDLALRAGVVDDAELQGRKLGDSPLALYASPRYLAARGTPRRLADLAKHDCVLSRDARGTTRWTLDGPRGRASIEVHGPVIVDGMGYAAALARRGVGITLLPQGFAQPLVAEGELVRVLPSLQQKGAAIYLVHPAARHLPRRVALLRDHLYEALRPRFAAC